MKCLQKFLIFFSSNSKRFINILKASQTFRQPINSSKVSKPALWLFWLSLIVRIKINWLNFKPGVKGLNWHSLLMLLYISAYVKISRTKRNSRCGITYDLTAKNLLANEAECTARRTFLTWLPIYSLQQSRKVRKRDTWRDGMYSRELFHHKK